MAQILIENLPIKKKKTFLFDIRVPFIELLILLSWAPSFLELSQIGCLRN